MGTGRGTGGVAATGGDDRRRPLEAKTAETARRFFRLLARAGDLPRGPTMGYRDGSDVMRYLVTARVRPGKEAELLRAVESGSLGAGSVAGDEYLRNMTDARLCGDGRVKWVEVCFC